MLSVAKSRSLTLHLFADDLLLFCKVDTKSIKLILEAFGCFSKASGFVANTHKSCVYLASIDNQGRQEILEVLNMGEGSFPFRYLGYHYTLKS